MIHHRNHSKLPRTKFLLQGLKIASSTLLLAGCTVTPTDLREVSRHEILQAETEMNSMAGKEGFNAALLAFADDSLVKPEEGKLPIVGKSALEAYWKGEHGTKGISWMPVRVEASASGDLGYSLGNWKYITPDSTYLGFYYTIWKKQPDGTWKWVVDGGHNTPGLAIKN